MKKKIQALVGGLALAAIVGVNGYMATANAISVSELEVADVEMMAEGDGYYHAPQSNSVFWDPSTWNMHHYNFTIHCVVVKQETSGYEFSSNGARSGNGSSITTTQELNFDIKLCGSGSGNCWFDDSQDCMKLAKSKL